MRGHYATGGSAEEMELQKAMISLRVPDVRHRIEGFGVLLTGLLALIWLFLCSCYSPLQWERLLCTLEACNLILHGLTVERLS